jgi:hypothetical protein
VLFGVVGRAGANASWLANAANPCTVQNQHAIPQERIEMGTYEWLARGGQR